MFELFKTVLVISLFGFILMAVLMALKPITIKKLPAQWQYFVWVVLLAFMLIPFHKLIPTETVKNAPIVTVYSEAVNQQVEAKADEVVTEQENQPLIKNTEVAINPQFKISLYDLISIIWLSGFTVFILVIAISYCVFLINQRKNAVDLELDEIIGEVKTKLNIKRKIRVKMSPKTVSPMLVGVISPVVYLPCKELSEDTIQLVLLHELTHYKCKHLIFKWVSIFVNAVHWFNPLAYILTVNIGEAAEVSCDAAVTKDMSDEQQKRYMSAILTLAEEG